MINIGSPITVYLQYKEQLLTTNQLIILSIMGYDY